MKRDSEVNILYANKPAASWETDRKRFLGDNEYGTWREPLSLRNEKLSGKDAVRGDIIAALQLDLGTLQSGETTSVITVLTQKGALSTVADSCSAIP
jgi:cellobiose phosphorylase